MAREASHVTVRKLTECGLCGYDSIRHQTLEAALVILWSPSADFAGSDQLTFFLSLSLSLSSHLVSKVRYEVRRQVCRVIDPGHTGVMEREEDLQRSECDVIQHPTDCLSDVKRKWGKVSDLCMV